MEQYKELFDLRNEIVALEERQKSEMVPLEMRYIILKQQVIEDMKASGDLSKRKEFATFTRKVVPTPKVTDENKVIAVLKKLKLATEYVTPRLKDTFTQNIKTFVKEMGVVDGIEIKTTEYLSIVKAKE